MYYGGLQNLYEEIDPPMGIMIQQSLHTPTIAKPFSLEELADKWEEFRTFIANRGEYLSGFLTSIHEVKVEEGKLVLLLENEFYKSWILEKDNKTKLKMMLSNYICAEKEWDIDVAISVAISTEKSTGIMTEKEEKIVRRYEDLVSGRNDEK